MAINVDLLRAIAQEFIEAYDNAFINPNVLYTPFTNLLQDDIVFAFPQEQQLFGNADTVISNAQFVGTTDTNPADQVYDILDFFFNGLTRFFPETTTVFEILPFGDDDDPDQDRVAIRLNQVGAGTQTGRFFEQPATFILQIDEAAVNDLGANTIISLFNGEYDPALQLAKVIERVEFYSNSYAIHAATADSPLVPSPVPENDPLTFQAPYNYDPDADEAAAIAVATQIWESLAVGYLFTASTLHAPDAVWSFAITGPNFLPYVGTAQGFTSNGEPLAPDFSNAGAILGNILAQLGPVIQPGDIEVVETFADGNRVLVHVREGATNLPVGNETGNAYRAPLDIMSWLTIENGLVTANEVIVNTFATTSALRPEETSPFGYSVGSTRHSAPYFVTGSRVNGQILSYDRNGEFTGVLYEVNSFDSPELLQPIGITYGLDGQLYVNSTLGAQDNAPIANAVLRYEGIYGDYLDGTTPSSRESRDRALDAVNENRTPRLQNVDPSRVADDAADPVDQPNDYNPALFGNAHGEYFDPLTGLLIDPGSLTIVPFDPNLGGAPNTLLARPFDATTSTLIDRNTNDIVYADGDTGTLFAVAQGPLTDVKQAAILSPTGELLAVFDGTNYINPANGQTVYTFVREIDPLNPVHITITFTDVATATTAFTFDTISDPRVIFDSTTGAPVGVAIPGLVIPSGIKFGPDGNLYVASAFTSRILQYDGETGEFLSVFGTRDNGVPVANLLDPAAGLPPDFTVFVFGPDGGIYQGSIRTDIDPTTGEPVNGDLTAINFADGYGAVLRFPGPTWEKDAATGWYIDPLNGNLVEPGKPAGIAVNGTDLTAYGVFGETGGILSEDRQPLYEPSAVAFGPDLNLYVVSAQTNQVLVYEGPVLPDGTPNPNAGRYVGVYADVGAAVRQETGRLDEPLVLSGMGFGPDGNLYVGSSFEAPEGSPNAGAPVGGSQFSVFVGPNPAAFGQTGNAGDYLGAYGDVTTEASRLLLPTTPEFVNFSNSYTKYNEASQRFPELFYVVGVNTDLPFNGTPGFFQADQTDAIAGYDRDMNFLGYLGTPLVDGKLGQDLTGRLFAANLTADQEVTLHVAGLTASGAASLSLNRSGSALTYSLRISGLDFGSYIDGNAQTPDTADDVTGFHFHNGDRGSNGGVVFNIFTQDVDDLTFTFNTEDGSTTIAGIWEETDSATSPLSQYLTDLQSTTYGQDSSLYFNIHTNTNTGGEIRGQITAFNPLSGIGGIELAASGDILVSSQLTDQILRYSSLTGEYLGVFGDASFEGSGLDFPAGIAISTVNQVNTANADDIRSGVFVSDLGNGRILRFDGFTGEFYDDPDTADVNEGVLAELEPELEGWRFTDLAFGPDGRIYVGLNSPLENGSLGSASVRVYNPENNTLEQEITGFDFVAALTFGPDNQLYVVYDPASLVNIATGQPLAPGKESRIVIYAVDYVHPILVGTDPNTGQPVGSPTGDRSDPDLINEFTVGVGNGGAISVTNDQATNTPVIFLSQPVAGTVALYTSDGVLQETLNPSLPGAANGVDENGIARPTGSAFLSEFIRQSSYANLLAEVVPNISPTAVVFSNAIAALTENTDTTGGIKVADISITDDGQGDNTLSLSGSDASSFEIRNNALYYIGNSPDFETKSSYSVTVNVDDITVGSSPDASAIFSLPITNLADQEISEEVPTFDDGLDNDGLGDLAYNLSNTTGDVTTKADDTALSQTDALFHNLVGLYQVENVSGAILDTLDINGNGATDDLLNPGDFGYARTAIANNISNFILEAGGNGDANKNTSASEFGDVLLQGGKFYAPFVIANGGDLIPTGGTLQDGINAFRTQNPENTAATLDNFITHQVAYFSFGLANPDGGVEHLQSRGNNTFGFEDLPGNLNVSDFDFNDSVFKFTFIA